MEVSPSPVPWSRFSAFIRQLGHDIRNDLNALSLEAALLKEIVTDPEAVISANRIQTQLRDVANRLKELSGRYALPAPQITEISLAELGSHLQTSAEGVSLEWNCTDSSTTVRTDPVLLGRAFGELVSNIPQKQEKPRAAVTDDQSAGPALILIEPGGMDYEWPEVPFATPKAGRYGAGLAIASAIFQGLGSTVTQAKTGNGLETRISLPVA